MSEDISKTAFVSGTDYTLKTGAEKLGGRTSDWNGFSLTSEDRARYILITRVTDRAVFEVTRRVGRFQDTMLVNFARVEAEERMVLVADGE